MVDGGGEELDDVEPVNQSTVPAALGKLVASAAGAPPAPMPPPEFPYCLTPPSPPPLAKPSASIRFSIVMLHVTAIRKVDAVIASAADGDVVRPAVDGDTTVERGRSELSVIVETARSLANVMVVPGCALAYKIVDIDADALTVCIRTRAAWGVIPTARPFCNKRGWRCVTHCQSSGEQSKSASARWSKSWQGGVAAIRPRDPIRVAGASAKPQCRPSLRVPTIAGSDSD
jgi:hypothetical protein